MNIWEILQVSGKRKRQRKGGRYTYAVHWVQHSASAHWAGPAARPRGRQGDVEGIFVEAVST